MGELTVPKGQMIVEVIVATGAVKSKNQIRRLLQQGAVEFKSEKISDETYPVNSGGVLRVGKKNFFKIKVF